MGLTAEVSLVNFAAACHDAARGLVPTAGRDMYEA
jgi:hypothetical protein